MVKLLHCHAEVHINLIYVACRIDFEGNKFLIQ
jgi:hypothetical protein